MSAFRFTLVVSALSFFSPCALAQDSPKTAEVIRAGMIGLDTSHAIAFTRMLNDPKATGDVASVKVVAGFPGGSPDIESSRSRVGKYTEQLRGMGIEIVDSIPKLLEKVDVVLLESVDGRPHLDQVIPVFKAGKPVFIDKPLAGSLSDAIVIAELGKRYKVPWFSSSSLRFSSGIAAMRGEHKAVGKVTGCITWGPCSIERTHPDLFWYGVHGVESLYTVMGPGCQTVARVHTDGTDIVTGVWSDGRVGVFRGIRAGKGGFGGTVFGSKGIAPLGKFEGYGPLIVEIAAFFKTKRPPIDVNETIELFAFMEAADESKRNGGKAVKIEDVMAKAKRIAALKLGEVSK